MDAIGFQNATIAVGSIVAAFGLVLLGMVWAGKLERR